MDRRYIAAFVCLAIGVVVIYISALTSEADEHADYVQTVVETPAEPVDEVEEPDSYEPVEYVEEPLVDGVLLISARTADWHALDISTANLALGDELLVVGRVGGVVADNTQMLLGGASSPWNWITSTAVTEANEVFELSVVIEDHHLSETQFERIRVQSNAYGAEMPFFVDNITITRGADVLYSLLDDSVIQANLGSVTILSGHPFLSVSGNPTITVVEAGSLGDDITEPYFDLTLPSLAELFGDYFMIGNIWSNPVQMAMSNTEAAFLHHFNAITAENHHKPGFIAGAGPDPATWSFGIQDSIVDFAEENGIAMIGHTLIWHSQSPAWLTTVPNSTEPLTRAEAMANMEMYINTVAGRWAGRIHSWDVLNEAIASSVGSFSGDWRNHLRTNIDIDGGQPQWYNAFANGANEAAGESGTDYIFYAFYFARQADPYAILFYNDYNEEQPGKRDAIAAMVEYMNTRWASHSSYDGRLLIEGIGLQSHFHLDQWATNFNNIRPAIERFIETGAVLAITELDITVGTQSNPSIPLTDAQAFRQAQHFARVFEYYLEFAEYIERVSIWGKADNQSWRAWGSPLLFNASFDAKEAFHAIVALAE
ncbi:MAG: endo-1,4-beta-xylanase [Turicibacter sp.]|nr:endo-1,4-beta-xylanase [Turicibacter sp.]